MRTVSTDLTVRGVRFLPISEGSFSSAVLERSRIELVTPETPGILRALSARCQTPCGEQTLRPPDLIRELDAGRGQEAIFMSDRPASAVPASSIPFPELPVPVPCPGEMRGFRADVATMDPQRIPSSLEQKPPGSRCPPPFRERCVSGSPQQAPSALTFRSRSVPSVATPEPRRCHGRPAQRRQSSAAPVPQIAAPQVYKRLPGQIWAEVVSGFPCASASLARGQTSPWAEMGKAGQAQEVEICLSTSSHARARDRGAAHA